MYYGHTHVFLLRGRNYQRPNIWEKETKKEQDDDPPDPPSATPPAVRSQVDTQVVGVGSGGDDDYVSVPGFWPTVRPVWVTGVS